MTGVQTCALPIYGLPGHLKCPDGTNRQSMAIYYLTEPGQDADPRGKALYIPTKDQQNDPEVLELILKRSKIETANTVYRHK